MGSLEQSLADLTSGDDARAEAAVPALTIHGDEAVAALLKLTRHSTIDERWWAVRAISAFETPAALSGLQRALNDPDPSVAQCAARGLRDHPDRTSIAVLVDAMQSKDRLLARLAADALSALGPEAIESLARAAKHRDPQVRIEAVRALAEMHHPDAIGPLFLALGDSSQIVNHWAETGLSRLGMEMTFFSP